MSDFNYRSIVVILPERLGDSLFHTPSIRLLKTQYPSIKLDVIALSSLCAEVLKNNPYVDAVHVLPNKSQTKILAQRYDVALLLHSHHVAQQYAEWLAIETIPITSPATPRHWSQHSLEFTCSLLGVDPHNIDGHYDLFPHESNFDKVNSLLRASAHNDGDILIGCHIGCHSIAKRGLKFWRSLTHPKTWPFENFVALEAALRAIDSRIRLVLTGSQGEKRLGEKFMRRAPRTINLIDKTSVLDLAALMDRLTLFLTPDTGAMHVACARKVGIVALFGPTQLQVTGPHPLRDNYRIVQAANLADIAVDEVLATLIGHPDLLRAQT